MIRNVKKSDKINPALKKIIKYMIVYIIKVETEAKIAIKRYILVFSLIINDFSVLFII